jgi:hypothetical protein
MIIDSLLTFDPAGTAITVSAASTNVLDMGVNGDIPAVQGRDIGISGMLKLLILSSRTFAAAGAATLNIQVQGAPDAGSNTPGTYVTFVESGLLSIAQLNAGAALDAGWKLLPIAFPAAPNDLVGNVPRFFRLNYVVATGPFTAGTLTAYLTEGLQQNVIYPSGIPTQY